MSNYENLYYSGLISIVAQDSSQEKEIKMVSKKIGLKPSIALALMHLRG